MEQYWEEKEEEEEEAVAALRGRQSRHDYNKTTGEAATTQTATATNDIEIEFTDGDTNVDITISETKILPSPLYLPTGKHTPIEKTPILTTASTNNGLTAEHGNNIVVQETTRQDVTDLYLEEVFKKQSTQDFYCPNCNSCIKKVILRGSDLDSSSLVQPTDEPVETFRCTSCLSFLIPAGNWFFPKLMRGEEEQTKERVPPLDSSTSKAPFLETANDQNNAPSSGMPDDQINYVPVINKLPPGMVEDGPSIDQRTDSSSRTQPDQKSSAPVPNREPYTLETVGVSLIIGTTEPKDNIDYQKRKPTQLEEVVADQEINLPGALEERTAGHKIQTPEKQIDETRKSDEGLTKDPSTQLEEPLLDGRIQGKGSVDEVELGKSTQPIIIDIPERPETIIAEARDASRLEIAKSVVYGGLAESITSLSVVTSAASAGAATLDIMALALANLIGGIFVISHNLWELKTEQPTEASNQTNEQVDRYEKFLGQRQHFIVHATIVLFSFIVFGLIPPLVYGFSFRVSDNKDFKLAAVAGASLLCIVILAIGKAYIQRPRSFYIYVKTIMYFVVIGFMASGVSYAAGDLIKKLIEKFGWFTSAVALNEPLGDLSSVIPSWAST